MPEQKKKLTVVSLFSGAGGLDIAACNSGCVGKLFSTDSSKTFLETVVDNIPTHFPEVVHSHVVSDAHELTGEMIRKSLGVKQVDLVMGGPPCDDFTTYGRKQGADGKKAPLIMEFSRLVAELHPRAFLFENVPNLSRQFKGFFDIFVRSMHARYKDIEWEILSARDYGSPTLRERLFAIGFFEQILKRDFSFPTPTHCESSQHPQLFGFSQSKKPHVTVGEVLSDLPDILSVADVSHINHTGRKHRPETVEHIKTVPQGIAISKSYRYRAPWGGLCRSLTAGVDDATKSYIHPIYHREMSVREYARIHGFPDSWRFSGNHHNGIKQVANSVPIPLGTAVIDSVVRALRGIAK